MNFTIIISIRMRSISTTRFVALFIGCVIRCVSLLCRLRILHIALTDNSVVHFRLCRGRPCHSLVQSILDVELTDLPVTPNRVFNVGIFATGNRVLTTSVALRDPTAGREVPVYVWDTAIDASSTKSATMSSRV